MASKKGKILIVDDNAGIRQALKILLPMHFAEAETLPSPVTWLVRWSVSGRMLCYWI